MVDNYMSAKFDEDMHAGFKSLYRVHNVTSDVMHGQNHSSVTNV